MSRNRLRNCVWKIIWREIRERRDRRLRLQWAMADSELQLLPMASLHLLQLSEQLLRRQQVVCLVHLHQLLPLVGSLERRQLLPLVLSLHQSQPLAQPLRRQPEVCLVHLPLPLELLHNQLLPLEQYLRPQQEVCLVHLHQLLPLVGSLERRLLQLEDSLASLQQPQPQEDYSAPHHQQNQVDSLEPPPHLLLVGFLDNHRPPPLGACSDNHQHLYLEEGCMVPCLPPWQFQLRLFLQQTHCLHNSLLLWKIRRNSWSF
mmetsp:Transcript_12836/g.27869  ORF Transcript_12836/g.27869 Transcript_12836/m.27869 type:complete len:259 (-) Transcript_12836:1646-2422(-)